MTPNVRVVNRVYKAQSNLKTTLENLNLSNATLYNYKPRMLKIRRGKLTILIFSSGRVRFMGEPLEIYEIELYFYAYTGMRVHNVELMSETICIETNKTVNPHLLSNFKPELFPAIHINYFKNVHVNLFKSGKVVVLGQKASYYIPAILNFINENIS